MDMNSLDFSQGDDSVQQFAVSPGGYLWVGKAPPHSSCNTHSQYNPDGRLRLRLDEPLEHLSAILENILGGPK